MILVLLALALVLQWLCALGLLVMRNPFDRLHAVGPGNILPPLLIAAAILWRDGFSAGGIKVLLIAFVIIVLSAALAHAIGRGARLRERDQLFEEK